MLSINNREMAVHNREWIAVNRKVRIENDALFFGIQVFSAQEARTLSHRLAIHSRGCAPDAVWNVTDEHFEPVDLDRPGRRFRKALHALREQRPGFELPAEQIVNLMNHLFGGLL